METALPAMQAVGDWLMNTGLPALQHFFATVGDGVAVVKEDIATWRGWYEALADWFYRMSGHADDLEAAIGRFFDAAGTKVNSFTQIVGKTLGPGGSVGTFFDHLGTKLHEIEQAFTWFVAQVTFHMGVFLDNCKRPIEAVGGFFDTLGTKAHALYDNSIGVVFGKGGLIGTAIEGAGGIASDWLAPGGKVGSFFDNVGTKAHELYDATIGRVFGTTGQIGTSITETGGVVDEWFGPSGKVAGFFAAIPGFVAAMVTGIGAALGGLANVLSGPIAAAQGVIHGFMGGLQKAVNAVGRLFGFDQLVNFSIDAGGSVSPDDGAGTGSFGTPANSARGQKDFKGGWSWVGEEGPELMYVPQHSTIVPHPESKQIAGGFPGFAGGLLGDVAGGVKSLATHVTAGAANALKDLIPSMDLPGLFKEVGPALVKDARDGLASLIASLLGKQVTAQNLGASSSIPSGGSPAFGGQFIKPVDGPFVQGSYGSYSHSQIAAVDWAASYGSPIWAPAAGQISFWGQNGHSGGTGNTVEIQHDQHFMSLFGHVHELLDQVGDMVAQGQTFAHSGAPGVDGGFGEGAHLHYELWHDGARVRPEDYMPMAEGAYVTSPTLAMIGEGRSPEIVAPEPKLREAVRDGLREAGGGGIAIYGGLNVYPAAGREGSDILDSLTAEARRRGMRLNGF
jgi:hypothetical protein